MSAVPAVPCRPRTVMVLSVELAVFDQEALARAANERAREDGLSDETWASLRCGMSDDLIMLLDPGLVAGAGFEIIQSTCEVSDGRGQRFDDGSAHAADQR
jgi:hypothetical protein